MLAEGPREAENAQLEDDRPALKKNRLHDFRNVAEDPQPVRLTWLGTRLVSRRRNAASTQLPSLWHSEAHRSAEEKGPAGASAGSGSSMGDQACDGRV